MMIDRDTKATAAEQARATHARLSPADRLYAHWLAVRVTRRIAAQLTWRHRVGRRAATGWLTRHIGVYTLFV